MQAPAAACQGGGPDLLVGTPGGVELLERAKDGERLGLGDLRGAALGVRVEGRTCKSAARGSAGSRDGVAGVVSMRGGIWFWLVCHISKVHFPFWKKSQFRT